MNARVKAALIRSRGNQEPESTTYRSYTAEMENKFHDRRGRPHYNNGRFAPRSEMEMGGISYYNNVEYEHSPESNYGGAESYSPRSYDPLRAEEPRMGRIGFYAEPEIPSNYPMDLSHKHHSGGQQEMEHGRAQGVPIPPMSRQMAEHWVKSMQHSDGSMGPKWQLEQVKGMLSKKGIDADPLMYWVAMHIIYSDYGTVLKKNGINENAEVYIDLAKAFLDDPDAQPDKLARYYECIVRH